MENNRYHVYKHYDILFLHNPFYDYLIGVYSFKPISFSRVRLYLYSGF
jgi:hypothetical protein